MKILSKVKIISAFIMSSFLGTVAADTGNEMNNKNNQNGSQEFTKVISQEDIKLTNTVKKALQDYSDKVRVAVQNGEVTLAGTLASDTDYETVVTLAESIKGVKNVNADALKVKDSNQPLQDTYITAKVKGSLIRYDVMNEDIPSWTIGVETKNGTVYLTGSVSNQAEHDKIINVVKSVDGVKQVDDKISISQEGNTNNDSAPKDDMEKNLNNDSIQKDNMEKDSSY